jgi:hypothetical protein
MNYSTGILNDEGETDSVSMSSWKHHIALLSRRSRGACRAYLLFRILAGKNVCPWILIRLLIQVKGKITKLWRPANHLIWLPWEPTL